LEKVIRTENQKLKNQKNIRAVINNLSRELL